MCARRDSVALRRCLDVVCAGEELDWEGVLSFASSVWQFVREEEKEEFGWRQEQR